jgi:predicted DNA-binding transcriptional regulator YafY
MIDHETKRLSRLVAILTLLQTKRLVTASELAKRFAVSIRTIYRDIRSLENAGIPIITEEGKGYVLMEGYRLPPVTLTEKEANAIVTAEQFMFRNKDASLAKDFSEAVNKIKAVLHDTTRNKANLLGSRIRFYHNTQLERTSDFLSTLQSALTNCNLVQMQYQSLNGDLTSRLVEPFALLSTQENWLLVGWCRLRKAYRIFRLDRIKVLSILPEQFQPHAITLQEYFEKFGK